MLISEEDFSAVQDKIAAWPILVVDDENEVYEVTAFVLEDIDVAGIPVELVAVSSAAEAIEVLKERNDIAVALLDVVMESSDAGLRLVETIRDDLKLHNLRIVLRTGQPGYAPEEEVMKKYDIDNYLSKAELSDVKLMTAVASAIRAYAHMTHLSSLQDEYENLLHQRDEEIAAINGEMGEKEEDQNNEELSSGKAVLEGAWQQIPVALLPASVDMGVMIGEWMRQRGVNCQMGDTLGLPSAFSNPLVCFTLYILYMESIGELEVREVEYKISDDKNEVVISSSVALPSSIMEALDSHHFKGLSSRYYLLATALKMVRGSQNIDVKLSLDGAGCLVVTLNLIDEL